MSRDLLPLATRVLTGEATAPEKKRLRELLGQPEQRAWFEQLRRRWEAAGTEPTEEFDATDAARRLAELIRAEPKSAKRKESVAPRSGSPRGAAPKR